MTSLPKKLIKIIDGDHVSYHTGWELLRTPEGQKILQYVNKKKPRMVCICRGDREDKYLDMHSRALTQGSSRSYTIVRNAKTKDKHHKDCARYEAIDLADNNKPNKQKEEKVITKAKIKTDDDGRITSINFTTSDHLDKYNKPFKKKEPSKEKKRAARNYSYPRPYIIGETLLTSAWQDYVTNKENNYNPKIGNLLHFIYTKLDNIKLKEVPLQDIIFKPWGKTKEKNIDDMFYKATVAIYLKGKTPDNRGYRTYIIGQLVEHEQIDNNEVRLKIKDLYKKNEFNIYTSDSYFTRKRNAIRKVKGADIYISAFVYPEKDANKVYVERMSFLTVMPDRGIVVDSGPEIEFAQQLIDKNILFIKPAQSNYVKKLVNFVNNNSKYIPDFLLLERETRKVATIAEVFGYYTDDYISKMKEKISYYKSLKDYNFVYWREVDGHPIPKLYQPRAKKGQIS